jgi:hypothetical protein
MRIPVIQEFRLGDPLIRIKSEIFGHPNGAHHFSQRGVRFGRLDRWSYDIFVFPHGAGEVSQTALHLLLIACLSQLLDAVNGAESLVIRRYLVGALNNGFADIAVFALKRIRTDNEPSTFIDLVLYFCRRFVELLAQPSAFEAFPHAADVVNLFQQAFCLGFQFVCERFHII